MKIIGTTVGTTIPKPNYEQTDPAKGDYIKGDISAAIQTDTTLTQEGQVADSKAVGDTIVNLQNNIADTYATKDLVSTTASGLMSAADKTKLDSIATGANSTVVDDALNEASINPVQNKVIKAALDEKADANHTHDGMGATYEVATQSADGLMSKEDKQKLDSVASGATKVTVDTALSSTSTNPVQNKVIDEALANKLNSAVTLSKDADLNNYTANGIYTAFQVGTAQYLVNNPLSSIGTGIVLEVTAAEDCVFQIIYGTKEGGTYKRRMGSTGEWSNWMPMHDVATTGSNGLMSATDKSKLDSVATGAEVNQNAFGKIVVGSTTIEADAKVDTFTIAAGPNITLTPDAANDAIAISATDTTYSAVVSNSSTPGLMTGADKAKLDGISAEATKVIVDSALSSTSTNAIQNKVVNSALAGKSNIGHTHEYIPTSQKGVADGVATLDSAGKVPTSQLPSYVDDVIEANSMSAFPTTGESGKIYVDTSTNKTYRWGGSSYVEISASLAIGTTSSTAAAGNHTHSVASESAHGFMSADDKKKLNSIAQGANNYTHPTHTAKSSGLYKITVDGSGHVSGATTVAKSDITALGIPAQDTTYSTATTSSNGLMSAADKQKLDGIAAGATNTKDTNTTYSLSKSGSTITLTGSDGSTTSVTDADTNTTYSAVVSNSSTPGLMTGADKAKLDGIATGATKVTVDSALSSTSTNPVQNQVVSAALDGKSALKPAYELNVGTPARYLKVCTLTPKVGNNDFNWVKFEVANNNTPFAEIIAYATIDQNGNITHKLEYTGSNLAYGKVYPNGVLEVWVKATDYAKTCIYPKSQFSRSGRIEWNFEAADALPVDSLNTITGTHVQWNGHAASATKASTASGLSFDSSGSYSTDAYGNFIASDSAATWNIMDKNATSKFSVEWATGNTNIKGNLTVAGAINGTANYAICDSNGNNIVNTYATKSVATTSANGLMSSTDKSKLDGVASGAEVNQNAFSNVVVGSTTIAADSKTDTLTLAGSNVTITPDATNDKVTIGITKDNVTNALGYTPPTTNTTYSAATQSSAGLMSADDKKKLDGVASGANNYTYTLPTATSSALGGVKVGSNITNSSGTISLTKDNVTSALGYTPPTTNTTYSVATTSANGLMSSTDKSKLDGIASNANNYSHPTSSGNKHIPSGGSSGQILRWSADGTAAWGADNNTTYNAATTSAAGLMSAADKTKLDGIATGATKITVDSALSDSSTNPVQSKVINSALRSRSHMLPTYTVSAGDENTYYFKLFTITPHSKGYGDLNYVFEISDRSSGLTKVYIYAQTANEEKYFASAAVSYDGALGTNITAYRFKDTTNKVERFEIWGKVSGWNTWKVYSKTNSTDSYMAIEWNGTKATALPTNATSTMTVSAKTAAKATKATQDGDGNTITSTYLPKSGGTMTGEIKIAQGDGKGIQIGLDGAINATNTSGVTNNTVLGVNGGSNLNVGSTAFTTSLRGKSDHPTYNGSQLALMSDVNTKANSSHTHDDRYYTESEIDSKVSTLNTAINGKAASSHTHSISNITNLQSTLDGKAASSHTHSIANVSGLQSALDGKASSSHTHTVLHGVTNSVVNMDAADGTMRYDYNIVSSATGLFPVDNNANAILTINKHAGAYDSQLGFSSNGGIYYRNFNAVNNNTTTPWKQLAFIDSKVASATNADYATSAGSAGSATSATKATQDGNGNNIVNTYATKSVATTSANGLMSSTDKSKLDGIASGANKYTHPSYTAKSSGLYKVTVDASGHVSATTAVSKSDITALGIPGSDTNTTYSAGTGISLSGTTFSNSGVRSISSGSTNGTISVNTNGTSAEVAVKGLGSAAYTNSSAYAASSHNHDAGNITSGTLALARIPTGTTSSTVALGNHTHSGYASSSHTHSYVNAITSFGGGGNAITGLSTLQNEDGTLSLGVTRGTKFAEYNHTHSSYASSSHTHDYEPKWTKTTLANNTKTINVADHNDYRLTFTTGSSSITINASTSSDIEAFIRIDTSAVSTSCPSLAISCPILSSNYNLMSGKAYSVIEVSIKYGYAIVMAYGT